MRKLFLSICTLYIAATASALTIPLWSTSTPTNPSWEQLVVLDEDFCSQLAVGDRIRVHVAELPGTEDWRSVILRNNNNTETDDRQFKVTATGDFTISLDATDVSKYRSGMRITADKINVDKIDYIKLSSNESETIWTGSSNLNWTTTYVEVTAAEGALFAEGDELIINLSNKYKSGSDQWLKVFLYNASGTEINNTTIEIGRASEVDCPAFVKYTLTSTLATSLQSGFRVSGDGVTASSIMIYKAAQAGDERILWEGSISPSWGNSVFTADATFSSSLSSGDQVSVLVSGKGSGQWPKIFLLGNANGQDKELGTVLLDQIESFPYEAKINITSDILTELKDSKLTISGANGATITQIKYRKDANYIAAKEQTLWTGTITNITWSDGGTQPNLKSDKNISFDELQVGDAIKVYVGEGTTENAGYQLKTSDWNELAGANGTVNKYGSFSYVIPTEEIAENIKENGVILSGSGTYEVVQIALLKAERFTIDENEDPLIALTNHNNQTLDFTITRPFYRDGYFNTICVPFSLTAEQIANSPLAEATIRQFTDAILSGSGEETSVDIYLAPAETIEAGRPYMISFPNTGDVLNSLTFRNVTISTTTPSFITHNGLKFQGMFAPEHLAESGNNYLFLGAENTLYWPNDAEESAKLKGFRAYFEIVESASSRSPIRRGMAARLMDQHNSPTAVDNIEADKHKTEKIIYDGQIIIIREDIRYNIIGQIL